MAEPATASDERSPLLPSPASDSETTVSVPTDSAVLARDLEAAPAPATAPPLLDVASLVRVVLVLMIGVFVSNADGSLVMATHPVISSEFNDLENSSWLFAGFVLASAATQTMYGKLSDIYGRKNLILVSYVVFAAGCLLVGAGQSMLQVILGRVISGAGSSGMTALVSILISDLLPLRDVATWRSYINIAATSGRSLGGPVGGWLADVIGWRWSFIGQVPFMMLAALLCQINLPRKSHKAKAVQADAVSSWDRLKRVDFLGSLMLALTLLAILTPLEVGGKQISWSSPLIPALFVLSLVVFGLFVWVERRAAEPVVPLEIFGVRDANLSILAQMMQTAAQVGVMFSVPLYFKATAEVSNTVAGAHLMPAVIGNAVGGIVAGLYIQHTGRYRNLIIAAAASASLSYTSLLVSWHGHTNWFQSLFIAPGGFGAGLIQSAVFVALQASVQPRHMAPAISILYLSGTCAMILGLVSASTVMQVFLKRGLAANLASLGLDPATEAEVVRGALSNIDFLSTLTGAVKEAVVGSYVYSLWWSHIVSLVFSLVALVSACFIGEKQLSSKHPSQADDE